MDRRTFFGVSLAAPAGLLGDRTIAPQHATAPASGLPLEALRKKYRAWLFDDFLPFMDRHVIDREHGGFIWAVGHDGVRQHDRKATWFEGRGTWVYAFLYNHFGRDARHLEIARRSLDLVLRARPVRGGLWPRELTREGAPSGPPETAVYGALFVAEGAAEFARATGERKYWDLARELVLESVERYDREDYEPAIGQTYLGPSARPFPGARVQGVWMVLIRVITQMLEQRPDPDLEAVADRSVDAILTRHYNPTFRLNNELLNHDLSRPDSEYAQLVYTGHCIETLWMLLPEALRRKDPKLFTVVADRFRRHVEVAWDDVYGGVLRNLMNVDANTWTLDKVLWAQEEVLIGALLIYERVGAPWAKELFERMLTYVETTYPLADRRSPIWMYAGNRRVTFEDFLTRPRRIENYHHPRHLMLNLLAVERLLQRGGAPAGVGGDL
jgi:N-acylglucosamine 2-epimerase